MTEELPSRPSHAGTRGLAGLAALAGAAAPDALNGVIKLPTTSYTSPSNQSLRVHPLEAGTQVQTLCFTEGQTLSSNFYWFRILPGSDLGFVHRDAIPLRETSDIAEDANEAHRKGDPEPADHPQLPALAGRQPMQAIPRPSGFPC